MILPLGLVRQAVRFLLVGAASAGVDIGGLFVLHGLLGVAVPPAAFVAFWTSFAVNFGLNRRWSFAAAGAGAGPQLIRFTILVVGNSLVTVAAVTGLVLLGLPYLWAKVITIAALACINFFVMRLWVFRRAATSGLPRTSSDEILD